MRWGQRRESEKKLRHEKKVVANIKEQTVVGFLFESAAPMPHPLKY